MNSSKKILLTLGIGMAAGAVAGLLVAPKKGSVTRRKIRKDIKRNTTKLMETIESFKKALDKKKEAVEAKMH